MKKTITAMLAVVATAMALPGLAQMGRMGFEGKMGGGVKRLEYDVRATGLMPVFPSGYMCDAIASSYGSSQRFDGSLRRGDRNSGLHGGLDISLKEGTPLLAVAAGKVIAKGEGGNLEGFYLWLKHAPDDTGLPYQAYTKYQHLVELPAANVGDRVAVGQVVALSGMTGTVGQAFGPNGYPHLHLSLFVASAPETIQEGAEESAIPPRDAKLADPMLLFLPADADFDRAAELPDAGKKLPVAAAEPSGKIHPAGSKVVWPVYCLPSK